MPRISIQRTHGLTSKAARAVAGDLAVELATRYGIESTWHGQMLKFTRPGLTGTFELLPGSVAINIEIGLLLAAFRSRIERQIIDQLDLHFAGQKRS